jgi:hypothetical protein
MAKRYTDSSAITVELAGGCLSQRVTQTFVRGDVLEARAPGRQNAIKLDERVKPLDRRSCVPAIWRCDIAEDFNNNNRGQQIGNRRGANEIVKTFCLSASLLLEAVAVRAMQRVVATDSTIRIDTIQRLGDRKRRRPRVDGRRSQRLAGWNPIVMQSLGCLDRPLSSSASGERGQVMAACL